VRELKLEDWWRVAARELRVGLLLGLFLATIGFLRVALWPKHETLYTQHYLLVAATVSISLTAIVLMGAMVGAMLPFVLRRLGFDPATASAPFVATLVDVTGLIIYFSVASAILSATLLSIGHDAALGLTRAVTPLAASAASGHCVHSLLVHP
jgi:magnesium transporter